jgi:AraC family transcriptional regulator
MKHYIDLLSILTPVHLRHGYENSTQSQYRDFQIHIFETFQSSTKVQIQYDGLSISCMIRGHKIVHTAANESFVFEPGTTLILPEGQSIYADFPEADANNPVQCATILIPSDKLKHQLQTLEKLYPQKKDYWNVAST